MTPPSPDTFAACMGSDRADAQHAGCRQAAGLTTREGLQLAPTPEALAAWGPTRRTRCHGHPVAVCLALDKGPRGSALRPYDFLVLFPLTPLTLARSREAFTPSRAQDDPTEAALQLALLLSQRAQLPPLTPQRAPRHALTPRVAHRRRRVSDNGRMTHRLTRTLKHSFPPVLHGFQEKAPPSLATSCVAGPPCRRCTSPVAPPAHAFSGTLMCALQRSSRAVSRPAAPPSP
jgi:hypothetical protein